MVTGGPCIGLGCTWCVLRLLLWLVGDRRGWLTVVLVLWLVGDRRVLLGIVGEMGLLLLLAG